MAVETIDIRIREDGSRVVKANFDGMARSAESAATSTDYLKRALELLAAAIAIDKIRDYADAWSSASGQIQVATESTKQAIDVEERLFAAAQRTRTGYNDMVELYARAARASTDLGASQEEIIKFSEGVGKALVIQHTSAQQASGSLLQLGQMLGSGKVKAEEFNSVQEQLSTVLTTAAKHIDGTGGSVQGLRRMMLAGKLTSQEFFQAFLKGSGDLDRDFAKSNSTIGQGLTVLSNAMEKFVGELDHSIGASNAFTAGAAAIAGNMDAIKVALGKLVGALATATAAWVTYNAVQAAGAATSAVRAVLAYTGAVSAGTVVTLGSAEAERQRAVAIAASASAQAASVASEQAANVAKASGALASAEAELAKVAATDAAIASARGAALASLAKGNADLAAARAAQAAATAAGAQSFALATLRTATLEAAAAEEVRSIALGELAVLGQQQARVSALTTVALTAQADAQLALNAAQATSVGANSAALAANAVAAERVALATRNAAGSTGLLAQAAGGLGRLLAPLTTRLAALGGWALSNPWTALATAIVVVTGALITFSDQIPLTSDGLVRLSDLLHVVKSDLLETFNGWGDKVQAAADKLPVLGGALTAIQAVINPGSALASSFNKLFDSIRKGFTDLGNDPADKIRAVARIFDAMVAAGIGAAYAIAAGFKSMWTLTVGYFKSMWNDAVPLLNSLGNAAIDTVNDISKAFGRKDLIPALDLKPVDVDPALWQSAGQSIKDAFLTGFKSESGVIEQTVAAELEKARQAAIERRGPMGPPAPSGLDTKKPGGTNVVDPNALKQLQRAQEQLRQLLNAISPTEGAILDMAKAYNVLAVAQSKHLITQQQEVEYQEALRQHYADIIDPLARYNKDIAQQTQLLDLDADARQTEAEVMQALQYLQTQNIKVGQAEVAELRNAIAARNDYARIVGQQDQLLANSVNRRRDYVEQLQAINELLNRPVSKGKGFSKDDAIEALYAGNQELLQGTQVAVDAQVAQYRRMYDEIKQMRAANVIDDAGQNNLQIQQTELLRQKLQAANADAAQARLNLGSGSWADGVMVGLNRLAGGFTSFTASTSAVMGDFFVSLEDGFAQSIGQAVIGAQSLGDGLRNVAKSITSSLISALVKMGIQWVAQHALMTAASTASTGVVTTTSTAAAGATTAAWAPAAAVVNAATFGGSADAGMIALAAIFGMVAALAAVKGFKDGGYTGGNYGTNDVAGVVHGQEFVVNAAGTKINRPLLEAMNQGKRVVMQQAAAPAAQVGGMPSISITNNGTPQNYSYEQVSREEIRVIAEDAVNRKAPGVIARDLDNANSRTSKSFSKNTLTPRRRSAS